MGFFLLILSMKTVLTIIHNDAVGFKNSQDIKLNHTVATHDYNSIVVLQSPSNMLSYIPYNDSRILASLSKQHMYEFLWPSVQYSIYVVQDCVYPIQSFDVYINVGFFLSVCASGERLAVRYPSSHSGNLAPPGTDIMSSQVPPLTHLTIEVTTMPSGTVATPFQSTITFGYFLLLSHYLYPILSLSMLLYSLL